jgi:F-type H+-transporting ATPase subunit gamma
MERFAELRRRIAGMHELLEIIGAMRSLAGVRMRQAVQAIPGIRRHAEIVDDAIAVAVGLLSGPLPAHTLPPREKGALLVFTSEHGFVGAFNSRLLERAAAEMKQGEKLFIVGSRGAALARESGREVAWWTPMASHGAGVSRIIGGVARHLYDAFSRGEIERVDLLFAAYRVGGLPRIERRNLLPLDLGPFERELTAAPPIHNLPPEVLLEKAIEEHFFAELMRAAMETVAAVNIMRLRATQSAHDKIGKTCDGLEMKANRVRQEEVTMELLDVVTGAETALDSDGGRFGT